MNPEELNRFKESDPQAAYAFEKQRQHDIDMAELRTIRRSSYPKRIQQLRVAASIVNYTDKQCIFDRIAELEKELEQINQ